jgi:20S proteasome alpha/beta subunit
LRAKTRILEDMTLIVGIKCDDGYVVCADSQETVPLADGTEARVTCQKLVPIPVGKMTVSIAGSGDADLIDAFVERLRVGYAASEISSLDACRKVIQKELAAFKKEKRLRRTGGQEPFSFLVGAQSQKDRRCILWRMAAGDLIEVQRYALVGYEDTRYDYAARNLFRAGMPLSQGVFLGLYIMWLGQHTSNYIHAPIAVAILKDNGLQFEDQEKIDSIDQKVRLFTAQFESQFLACSDTGLQGEEFGKALTEFGATVIQFRREFIEEWVGQAIDTGLDRTLESWNSVPTGTMIVTVPMQGEAEKSLLEMHERIAAELHRTAAHTQELDRIISNLHILRDWLVEASAPVPGQAGDIDSQKAQKRHDALTEINQAAMMGPYKVTPEVHGWLVRTRDFMVTSPEELSRPRLHKATIAVRIATIDQALAVVDEQSVQPSESAT